MHGCSAQTVNAVFWCSSRQPTLPWMQVRLLYDGNERGQKYAAYALSSGIIPGKLHADERSAGAIPALVAVLNTSKVLASKTAAVNALCHLVRFNEAAVDIVMANGLPALVAQLDCGDAGLVER